MSRRKIKVLIVDDSDIVVDRLSGIIAEMVSVGPVLISNSFNQAVDLISVEVPDVILLDIQLPGKNGIELLAFLKSNYSGIKTIVVTNRASAYYKDLCEEMGADSFIDKSTEFEKIPEIIESFFFVHSSEANIHLTHQ